MAETLTRYLGRMASRLNHGELPEDARRIAKTGIADCYAVLVAGSHEPAVGALHKTLAALGGPAEAPVGYAGPCLPAPHAAWINGTAGHVLDYDDVARGHPSVAIVPAILAEGLVLNASGSQLIAAYVAGYETWMELVVREPDSHQMKGLHPTAIFGALAAAAACANLRKLDADAATSALGIAAAHTSGITASYGTMVKAVQVGRAAYTGVMAARAAANGMRAADNALDGERGFLRALSPQGRADIATPPRAGRDWHILRQGLSIKRYPMCYCAHRAIDAALETAPRLTVSEIERIEVTLGKIQAVTLKNHRPQSGMDALFSVEFAVAAALTVGNVGLREVSDDFVRRADIQNLLARVSVNTTEDYDPEEPALSRFDQVRFFMRGGGIIDSAPVARALGSAQRPISAAALRSKFIDCLAVGVPGLPETDAGALFDRLQILDDVASLRELPGIAPSAPSA